MGEREVVHITLVCPKCFYLAVKHADGMRSCTKGCDVGYIKVIYKYKVADTS